MNAVNLLLDQNFYDGPQLQRLLKAIDKANPGAKWTRKVERMGPKERPYRRWEAYYCNGAPVFEIVEHEGCPTNDVNDIRTQSTT